uniref:Uncharacterized protein n=1 Tax=Grammatophora oceanica TaxID=210454 RepID=A0A7S1VMH2_9STRA
MPTEIGQLGQLKSLAMGRNMLTGTLPAEWSALTSLEGLFLASNSLTGTVPESWNTTNFDSISEILLNANNLTGTLDRGFCDDATNYTRFVSDCLGEDAPVECSCCTVCCDHSEPGICNQTRASSK